MLDERILDDVRRGVRGRERYRDDKARRNEPEQDENEHLSFPTGKQLFEHRDRTVAVRALLPRPACTSEEPRKVSTSTSTSVAKGDRAPAATSADARLITERRKIIDAGQAHDLPPRSFVVAAFGFVRTFWLAYAVEKPLAQAALFLCVSFTKTKKSLSFDRSGAYMVIDPPCSYPRKP